LLATVGIIGALRLLLWYWPGSVFGSGTSGTWTALAWDAAHGDFYRPLLGPAGYGGTRYMPLLFLIHAALIRTHSDPVYGAVVLMQSTVVASAVALYAAMRAADVPARLALPFACTTWATIAFQEYATEIRADYLAAAFALTAVAASMRGARDRWSTGDAITIAACVLAGLTKLTTIVVAAPIVVALAKAGRRRAARSELIGVAVCFGAALVVVQLSSSGHFSENLRATLTAGMTTADVWRRGIPIFADYLVTDPFIAVPFAFAAWSAIAALRRHEWSLPLAYWLTVAGVTIVILASRGTATNHMVEVHLTSVLATAVALSRFDLRPRVVSAAYLALAALMAAWSWPVPGLPSTIGRLKARGLNRRATVAAVRADYGGAGRYLSLDPIVPVLSGERPRAIDAFYLDLFVDRHTAAGRDLSERVGRREFDAIFVSDADWKGDLPVMRLFRTAYEAREVRHPFVVLQPVQQATSDLSDP